MKLILTGATGMMGEGMLLTCLDDPAFTEILMVNRRPSPVKNPKLSELMVKDFTDLEAYRKKLTGYDCCMYCAGISSFGMNEQDYGYVTFQTTMIFAGQLAALNPQMVFFYLSGVYADSSAKGSIMWARIKGKTENALAELPFRNVYSFRPGFIIPLQAQKNVKFIFKMLNLIYPYLFPKQTLTYKEIVTALSRILSTEYGNTILEIKDLKSIAHQKQPVEI
ncbi:epimerase [Chryseobacterium sp. Leaf180]|uniref:NAD-dependent epimerase/dehydratase family protein n=1 Tax=Chryseobacterium sp. Leaf180 TaxID=1736289 RepID=UPI0006FC382F|nr:NAD-dependent epimerase/dehydratase family protein [Chryseobacterium sp. Leaf180]KQR90819.1 epimerase [Chryseobacterium sp. Leaf180]